jgi:hypothetical protein
MNAHWSKSRQTVAELSDCNNFELNIFILYILSENWKSLYMDYIQISGQAVAILSQFWYNLIENSTYERDIILWTITNMHIILTNSLTL